MAKERIRDEETLERALWTSPSECTNVASSGTSRWYVPRSNVALEGLAAAFTGKPWDVAAQMYYFPYRWYSPSAARWLTRDPLGMVDGPNVSMP